MSAGAMSAKNFRLHRVAHALLIMTLAFGCLAGTGSASAAESIASQMQTQHFPVAQIFTFLFLMLGPFKVVGPFAKITKGVEAGVANRIALWATLFSSLALLVAAFLGETFLTSYGIPLPVLALSAGIILFLVALLNILQQFTPPAARVEEVDGPAPTPTLSMAMTPLAFPTIVTPYGIATLVVVLALAADMQSRLIIGAIVLAIMVLNLVVMILTRHMLRVLGVLLPILGAVLGVIQVALGLQIISNSLRSIGVM